MPKKIGSTVPDLTKATEWMPDVAAPSVNGSPLLLHFWARSCPACKGNMPSLQALRDRYGKQGLQVIAVHMPRGEFDLDVEKVRAAVEELGMTEPCAIDNDHTLGEQLEVHAWPTYYLFDAHGLLKRHAAGNFGVRMIEAALKDMFPENPEKEEEGAQ